MLLTWETMCVIRGVGGFFHTVMSSCLYALACQGIILEKELLSLYYYFLNFYYYLFLVALGLCCCAWAFSSCSEQGLLFVAVHRLLIAVASRCRARALGARASGVVAHRLSCSVARGIFPDQGSNPCPLHWQADS